MQVRTPVEAPPVLPPRYGLIAAAQVVDDPELRWVGGFAFETEQCGIGGVVTIQCAGGVGTPMDPERGGTTRNGDPFAIWAGDLCSTLGYAAHDREARARRQLEAIQSFELAAELWKGTLRTANTLDNAALVDATSDTLTNGGVSETSALACIEYALGFKLEGRRGMVHMTTQALTHLHAANAVLQEGGQWMTPNGHLIVPDAGYDGSGPGGVAAGATQWMFGTSMIQVRLGPVQVFGAEPAEGIDRLVNDWTVQAVRPAAFQWDECAHVAAEVERAVCLIAGAS